MGGKLFLLKTIIMTKILESLSAFEGKSINKLEMKNVMGGLAAVGTGGGSRQVGCADGVSYWTFTYTSDTSNNGVVSDYCNETGVYTAN
jgi:hypothetical protein